MTSILLQRLQEAKEALLRGDSSGEILSIIDPVSVFSNKLNDIVITHVTNIIDNSKTKTEAAQKLGISRSALYSFLRRRQNVSINVISGEENGETIRKA